MSTAAPTRPASARGRWTDERVEQIVGNLLRTGVLTAAAVVLLAGVYYLARHGNEVHDYQVFRSEPRALRSIGAIMEDALTGSSVGIIQLGVLLLLATPVARVLFSVAAFVLLRDRMYVVVTLLVLAILLYSLFHSTG